MVAVDGAMRTAASKGRAPLVTEYGAGSPRPPIVPPFAATAAAAAAAATVAVPPAVVAARPRGSTLGSPLLPPPRSPPPPFPDQSSRVVPATSAVDAATIAASATMDAAAVQDATTIDAGAGNDTADAAVGDPTVSGCRARATCAAAPPPSCSPPVLWDDRDVRAVERTAAAWARSALAAGSVTVALLRAGGAAPAAVGVATGAAAAVGVAAWRRAVNAGAVRGGEVRRARWGVVALAVGGAGLVFAGALVVAGGMAKG